MGYLSDNTPANKNWVFCEDLYKFRIRIDPRLQKDIVFQKLVKDVLPDVEEWQYSGRRLCPRPAAKPVNPIIFPDYAVNSRKKRQYTALVIFAFNLSSQRDAVAARLDTEGYNYSYEDEPTPPVADGEIILLLP